MVGRALAGGRFTGAAGQTLDLVAPHGVEIARVAIVGVGKQADFDERAAELGAARAWQTVKASGVKTLVIRIPGASPALVAHAALGVRLGAYRFDRYRTTEKAEKKPSVTTVRLAGDKPAAAAKAWKTLSTLADAIILARDLVSEPANVLYP